MRRADPSASVPAPGVARHLVEISALSVHRPEQARA